MATAFALFSYLVGGAFGGWEVVFILAVILLFLGARYLPLLARGLGLHNFWKALDEVSDELNPKESGLVYEAFTHDNRTAGFVYPHRSELPETVRAMILLIAQGFGAGRIPVAPGTFGSLVGLLWFAALLATKRYELYVLGAMCGIGLSVWLCGAAEKILKQKDPSSVVLDEIVALPFCFLPWVTTVWLNQHRLPALETFISGRGWLMTAGIFVLFRIFDILKPWPIGPSQRLPGGWGVTVDDLLAAAGVALLSLLFIFFV